MRIGAIISRMANAEAESARLVGESRAARAVRDAAGEPSSAFLDPGSPAGRTQAARIAQATEGVQLLDFPTLAPGMRLEIDGARTSLAGVQGFKGAAMIHDLGPNCVRFSIDGQIGPFGVLKKRVEVDVRALDADTAEFKVVGFGASDPLLAQVVGRQQGRIAIRAVGAPDTNTFVVEATPRGFDLEITSGDDVDTLALVRA